MKKLALILMIPANLLIANTSRAALGWTLEGCKAHLGVPLKDKPQGTIDSFGRIEYNFHSKGYNIMILLEKDGTVGRVAYSDDEKISISRGQILILLNANSKSKWPEGKLDTDRTTIWWKAEDGTEAAYDIENKCLIIYTATDAAMMAAKDKTDANDL